MCDHTNEMAGSGLPLIISTIPRRIVPQDVDLSRDAEITSETTSKVSGTIAIYVDYRAGEVIALRNNYKTKNFPFFLAVLKADVRVCTN